MTWCNTNPLKCTARKKNEKNKNINRNHRLFFIVHFGTGYLPQTHCRCVKYFDLITTCAHGSVSDTISYIAAKYLLCWIELLFFTFRQSRHDLFLPFFQLHERAIFYKYAPHTRTPIRRNMNVRVYCLFSVITMSGHSHVYCLHFCLNDSDITNSWIRSETNVCHDRRKSGTSDFSKIDDYFLLLHSKAAQGVQLVCLIADHRNESKEIYVLQKWNFCAASRFTICSTQLTSTHTHTCQQVNCRKRT